MEIITDVTKYFEQYCVQKHVQNNWFLFLVLYLDVSCLAVAWEILSYLMKGKDKQLAPS